MKIKLSEINNCGKSLIFEAGEIDKLKEKYANDKQMLNIEQFWQ